MNAAQKVPVELIASYWTISAGVPHTDKEYSPRGFRERVEAAARAGFKGFGIWHADLEHVLQHLTLKEMKQILDDNGIKHVELEFLTDWFLSGDRKQQSDCRKRMLLQAAEVLHAHHVKVGDFFREQVSIECMVAAFADLCEEGAAYGTRIGFELMPFAMIDNLNDAVRLVREAGAKNGGIVLDMWHIAKLKIPYADISAIPIRYITGVELNDGTLEAPWSLHEDTINHRRLCGEGEFDVKGLVRCVQGTGYDGPWGIEVLSQDLRARPLEEVAKRAFDTTMAQFR